MLYSVLYVVYGIENMWKDSISVYRILYTAVYFIDCLARKLIFTRKPNDSASSNYVARFMILDQNPPHNGVHHKQKNKHHVFFVPVSLI